MVKQGKKYRNAIEEVGQTFYSPEDAIALAKKVSNRNFDEAVEVHILTSADPKHADQQVRGFAELPHGTGKQVRVLVFAEGDVANDAKEAGADHVGLDEYLNKIKGGWTDVDVIVTMPSVMGKLGPLGRVLGPRGLMPNPKTGTVTMDVAKAVSDVKSGKIDFKVEKTGIVHAAIGKASFDAEKIEGNAKELLTTLVKLKPQGSKGVYIKSIFMSSTMSPGVKVEPKSISI